MHPFENDSLIHVDIQADNKLEILTCVRESFLYMPGWVFDTSAVSAMNEHPESRFFSFNLTGKTFVWWRTNDTLSDTQDEDETIVKDLADISGLLEFVYVNADELRKNLAPKEDDLTAKFKAFFNSDPPYGIVDSVSGAPPKKKRKKDADDPQHVDLAQLYHMLMEKAKANNTVIFGHSQPKKSEWVDFEDEPGIKAKMYYKDWSMSTGGKSMMYPPTFKVKMHGIKAKGDISTYHYDEYLYSIEKANTEGELTGLYNKFVGLHGPLATDLRNRIEKKIAAIKLEKKKQQMNAWKAEQELKKQKNHEFNSWNAFQKAAAKKDKSAAIKVWESEQLGEPYPYTPDPYKYYKKKVYYDYWGKQYNTPYGSYFYGDKGTTNDDY